MSNTHYAKSERFIAFVVPVRPLKGLPIAEDVLKLLSATVCSVLAQSDPNWRLLLVSSDGLDISVPDDRIVNIVADGGLNREASSTGEAYNDMHLKRLVGSRSAISLGASHVMFVDADDLINRNVAEYVNCRELYCSYLGSKGWEVMGTSHRAFYRRNRFAARCGTCAILSQELLSSDHFCGMECADIGQFYHHTFVSLLLSAGASDLPFPVAVYRTDHKANITMGMKDLSGVFDVLRNSPFLLRRLLKALRSVPYDSNLMEQFGALECPSCVTLTV